MNNKKEDPRGNDEVTNTFVPAVFFQTSLRFPQNDRADKYSTGKLLVVNRRSMFPADKLHGGNNLMSSRERGTR